MSCDHPSFNARVDVIRVQDSEGAPVTGYLAEVRLTCAACSEAFAFPGLPVGMRMDGPSVSLSGLVLRVPVQPEAWGTPLGPAMTPAES